ncbi:MAG TPA: FAD-dependent oxidoreductase [Phycisphaerae bacterium]|nr:FAD-dependent oxidoreductase [Phycisphaerae bacterium]HNU45709.1 FAD-dependent oxidoreductase [Phycisphaerae bacterium]
MRSPPREDQWQALDDLVFDVVIVGSGINGACLYHHLCRQGFSTLLIDKGDFASGTSQASAMMIWGGLLYLRHGHLRTVGRLCAARERMLRELGDWIRPRQMRYVATPGTRPHPLLVQAALYFYWLLSGCQRRRPRWEPGYPERVLLAERPRRVALTYEEAMAEPSDARFVLQWLLPHHQATQVALNYCALEGGGFDAGTRRWHLELRNTLHAAGCRVRARVVVNAAGAWVDRINESFGCHSPYKHVLSKGVFLGLRRHPAHELPLILPTRDGRDAMSLIPWGSVSLWGPTETVVETPEEGFAVQPEDVRLLLDELHACWANPLSPRDVVSLRSGVRPLVVERRHANTTCSLALSRRHEVHADEHLPWISVYGGKLTNCVPLARRVERLVRSRVARPGRAAAPTPCPEPVPVLEYFPDLKPPVPNSRWCAEQEMCQTLEDYLRRRTNVAQWVPRGGLGPRDEYAEHLVRAARPFCADEPAARRAVAAYHRTVVESFDDVLAHC